MHTYLTWARLPTLVLALACTAVTVRPAVAAAPVPAKAAASQGTFTREQLDQMLAPVQYLWILSMILGNGACFVEILEAERVGENNQSEAVSVDDRHSVMV